MAGGEEVGGGAGLRLRGDVEEGIERGSFIDNLLVRIHFIIVMIKLTALAPWEFEWPYQVALYLPSQGDVEKRVI